MSNSRELQERQDRILAIGVREKELRATERDIKDVLDTAGAVA